MLITQGLLFAIAFILVSCATSPGPSAVSEHAIATSADPDIRNYANTLEARAIINGVSQISQPRVARNLASESGDEIKTSTGLSGNDVALYLPSQSLKTMSGPAQAFAIRSKKDTAEIEKLKTFLISQKALLGAGSGAAMDLKFISVIGDEKRSVVRFQQLVVRHPQQKFSYNAPIEGADLVVNLNQGLVKSINSTLVEPPVLKINFTNAGIDLTGLSDHQFAILLTHMRTSANFKALSDYLSALAQSNHLSFNLADFVKMDTASQRTQLVSLFKTMGFKSTLEMMINLARRNRLSLAQRPKGWVFHISGLLGLPIEFDIDFPQSNEQLRAHDLRELQQRVAINIYDSPNYPLQTGPVEAQATSEDSNIASVAEDGRTTAEIFQGIVNYFKKHHNWENYSGHDLHGVLNVHTNLVEQQAADNAAWNSYTNSIMIGAGGTILQNQKNSVSVLGHEFTHAIVEFSSGLLYQGESGALNEHFADIEGAYISAERKGRPFVFTIGEDAMNPTAVAPRKQLVDLVLQTQKVPASTIEEFSLDLVALRNLFAPQLSFSQSFASVQEAGNYYTSSCVPNANNDACGVHSLSGIPNRAVALMIHQLGASDVRNLVFRTVTMRLNSRSNFQEYLRQMNEECLASSEFDPAKVCPVVVDSFKQVGIVYPSGTQTPKLPSTPAPPAPLPQTPVPEPNGPQSTPLLKMCGWISVNASKNVTVIDNKYDTAILAKNYATLTKGDYSSVYSMKCGCVSGHLSQIQNSKGVWFNYFADITAVLAKPPQACQGIVFK